MVDITVQVGVAQPITVTSSFYPLAGINHNALSSIFGDSPYYHLSTTAYTYLGSQDQSVKTTGTPTFASFTLGAGATVNYIDTDGTLAANSDLRLSTQKAIKTYVDAQVSAENLWDRTLTVLSPHTSGDSVDLGTASLTAAVWKPSSDATTALQVTKSDGTTLVADVDTTNSRLGLLTNAPTHTLTLASTATGIALYNTSDQTTNYERLLAQWSANIFSFGTIAAGSGTGRALKLSTTVASGSLTDLTIRRAGNTESNFAFTSSATASTLTSHISLVTTWSQTSSTPSIISVTPTINQSSTAGYNILLINPTESATGSGAKNLILAQVGSSTKFGVDNTGIVTITTGLINPKWYPSADSTTAIQINKSDGSTNIVTVDTTNSRVGIGTTAPAGKLHIDKNTTTITSETDYGLKMTDGLSLAGLLIGTSNASSASIIQSYDVGTAWTGVPLVLQPNGGNVGVGTTLPSGLLSAGSAGGSTTGFVLQNVSGTRFGQLYYSGNDVYLEAERLSTSKLFLGAGGSSAQQITIDGNTSYVGIANASPAVRLDVKSSGTDDGIYMTGSTGTVLAQIRQQSTSAGRFLLGSGSTQIDIISSGLASFTNSGNWEYKPAGTARVMFLSTGQVGIGNASPNVSLTVGAGSGLTLPDGNGSSMTPQIANSQTSGNASIEVCVNDGTNNRRMGMFVDDTNGIQGISSTYSSTIIPFVYRDATGEKLRIDTSGRVGIGSTNPDNLLSLNAASGNTYISFRTAGSSKAFIGISDAADAPITGMTAGDLGIRVQANDLFMSADSGVTAQIVLKNSGNVGIGIAAPTARFHVVGSTSNTSAVNTLITDSAARARLAIRDDGLMSFTAGTGSTSTAITLLDIKAINTNGYTTGLATNHGTILLHETGDGPEVTSGIELQNSGSGSGYGYKLYTNNTNDYLAIGTRYNSATWTNAITLKQQTGKVGIGTVAPSAYLHILGTTEQLRVGYDTSNYYSTTVGSTGTVTLDAVGSASRFAFSDAVNVTDTLASSSVAGLSISRTATDEPSFTTAANLLNTSNQVAAAFSGVNYGCVSQLFIGGSNTQNWTGASATEGAAGAVGVCGHVEGRSGWSGTITSASSFLASNEFAGGTVTNLAGLRIVNTVGTGTVTNQYGIYINALTKGSTSNYGIYEAGTTALNYFGSPVQLNSNISQYKAVTTTGWGVHSIYGAGRSTAQTAAVSSVATYTVGSADGSFIVSANVNVTTSTTHTIAVQVDYTDETNVSRTLTLNFSQLAGTIVSSITNVTGAGPYEGIPNHIRCKASTAITVKTTGTFTTVTYNVEGSITQIA